MKFAPSIRWTGRNKEAVQSFMSRFFPIDSPDFSLNPYAVDFNTLDDKEVLTLYAPWGVENVPVGDHLFLNEDGLLGIHRGK